MLILGIETSCDETSAAIVEDGKRVLSNVVTSSEKLQQYFGGIIPEQAAREQLKCIIPVLDQALREAFPEEKDLTMKQFNNLAMKNIDAIAVTHGPGLIGSLIVGVETAKTLSFALQKPLIPINHLLGHVYANFLDFSPGHSERIRGNLGGVEESLPLLPAICLVASGGHTDLLLMKPNHAFKWLGGTRDDAAGECFDKCARLLDLGYPGGPAIEQTAKNTKYEIHLPRPMIHEDNFDFSFSGLKTAVLTLVKNKQAKKQFNHLTMEQFAHIVAYEIQEAITDVLIEKTLKAGQKYKVKSILIGGGVAANARLREKFKTTMRQCSNVTMKLFIPDKKLCTDNATVIAATAFYQNHPVNWRNLKPDPSLHFK